MISRKEFLKRSISLAAGSALMGPAALAGSSRETVLTILYTNDTHARLDPIPDHAIEHSGLGGIARRANLVKQIRNKQSNVLLLDAGDVFQGTPWFDLYGGEVDLKLMSEMKYDAMAVGNHEFDNGLESFASTADHADFPVLAANYSVLNTPLDGVVQRFMVKEIAGIRVGIFGLGIELNGVVDPRLFGAVRSRDPEVWANGMVRSLRQYHNCDVVICLSHLGYSYDDNRMDDVTLAEQVGGIDFIIGGHTHTFLDHPVKVENPDGKLTLVTQMGHSGIRLGRIDLIIDRYLEDRPDGIQTEYYTIGKPS